MTIDKIVCVCLYLELEMYNPFQVAIFGLLTSVISAVRRKLFKDAKITDCNKRTKEST